MKVFLHFLVVIMPGQMLNAQHASNPYLAEITDWQQRREAALKAETGWLNLAGLYWLKPGENSFGSGMDNTIVFPDGRISAKAGTLHLQNDRVVLRVKDAAITINGKPVDEALVYHPDSAHQPMMSSGSLRWTIIKRWGQLGIRLRDLASDQLVHFKGIEHYPIDSNYRIKAVLRKPVLPAYIPVTNVLGQTRPEPSPGKIFFSIDNTQYAFDTLEEEGLLFIIFGDATSGQDTYGAGRYMKAQMPGPDGITILDFNKAYNPPCAFTAFATCPLPPPQNILPVEIKAGERNYSLH